MSLRTLSLLTSFHLVLALCAVSARQAAQRKVVAVYQYPLCTLDRFWHRRAGNDGAVAFSRTKDRS